jgi:hypothetical protein
LGERNKPLHSSRQGVGSRFRLATSGSPLSLPEPSSRLERARHHTRLCSDSTQSRAALRKGLSGTGSKAGGPRYLHRFATERTVSTDPTAAGGNTTLLSLQEENEVVAS